MRIISDFKDYYDCIQRLGQSDLVYLRKPQTHQQKNNFGQIINSFANMKNYGVEYCPILIGFCGQYYPAINKVYDFKSECLYDKEKILEEIPGRKSLFSLHDYVNKFFSCKWDFSFTYEEPLFVAYETTNNYRKKIEIRTNTSLKDYNFQKIFDPYSAYQRLHEFLGSMAKPEKPLPILDDITMRDIKGFDKFSFRKDKDEPKRRIKRN